MITAKVIEDSVSEAGVRLTTLQLCYPRFIHAEFMTHRVFSRNASSSRAIPVAKMLEMVRNEPAMPVHWGKNQPGMQAHEELGEYEKNVAQELWMRAARLAAQTAEEMSNLGLHKQVANRILEPFQHIHVVVTATEWSNFFALRAHPDAQPEFHELAIAIKTAMEESEPKLLKLGDWHLPYVTAEEREVWASETLAKVSAARCCRVSYLKHDGSVATLEEDLALCERLAGSVPIHASPFEHQAKPDFVREDDSDWHRYLHHGNFVGWIQYRKLIEQQFNQSQGEKV